MASKVDLFFDMAFDRAYQKLLKMHKEGYLPLSKANMRKIAKETALQVRQETLVQLGGDLDTLLSEFEKDLAGRMDEWGQSTAVATGRDEVFPEGCKFATCKDNSSTFIIEQKPQVRTVMGGNEGYGYGRNNNHHQLAFPYIVFGVHFVNGEYANCTVNARNNPLNSLNDQLGHLYISNIYKEPDKLGICMYPDRVHGNLNDQCQQVIGHFWQSAFHGGNPHNHTKTPDARIKNWKEWEKNTKKDPNFIMEVEWPSLGRGYNVKKLIERIRANGNIVGRHYGRGAKGEVKIQNFFRRQGQILLQRVQKAVMGVVVDDYEPEIDPEFEAVVHEVPAAKVPEPIERDNLAALAMAKAAAKRGRAKDDPADYEIDPYGRRKAKAKPAKRRKAARPVAAPEKRPARGQKKCPECGDVHPVRLRVCDCGWHFGEGRKIPMPPVKRPAPAPEQRKIPRAVEDKIKDLVGKGAEIAKRAKAARPGKGKKQCPKCNAIMGAKTRFCACGNKFY
tara:strand:- start:531 stop:2045 length:1515 start_codon:yes stop_codon:yes gene_type:complete